jgi:HPt (histidine-containing phosphotransfer) domain-containing protein
MSTKTDMQMDAGTDEQPGSLEDALAKLNALFAEKLPARLSEIEAALNQFVQHPQSPESLGLLHRLLHTMSGSAGTFGFDQLGAEARQLDVRIKPLLAGVKWTLVELTQFATDVRVYLAAAAVVLAHPTVSDPPASAEENKEGS